jgi:hypothetical protein
MTLIRWMFVDMALLRSASARAPLSRPFDRIHIGRAK